MWMQKSLDGDIVKEITLQGLPDDVEGKIKARAIHSFGRSTVH